MASGVVDALNRVFRCTTFMSCRGTVMQTSLHLRDTAIPNATAESIHAEYKPWVLGTFLGTLSKQVKIERIAVERLLDGEYYEETIINTVGTQNDDMAATFLALAVTFKSTSRKRWANNRAFWPYTGPVSNDLSVPGQLGAAQAAAADLMSKFGGVILIGDGKLVAVGAPENPGPVNASNPPRWTDVEQVRVNPIVSTMRSRKSGVGS